MDDLELLAENELWVELFSLPTSTAPCSVATCQNVVGGRHYEIVGDVGAAKAAALSELMQNWMPTSDADVDAESIDFQLREDIDIETTSRTAFVTIQFVEDFQSSPDEFVPDAILLTFTSDTDPNWIPDTVLKRDNFTLLGIGLTIAGLCLVVTVPIVVARRRSSKTAAPGAPIRQIR